MPSSASSCMTENPARPSDERRQPGPGDDRPTIVFLHGTRLTGASWAVQIEDLSEEFHCLAPDLLGHGSVATESFTLDGAAERIADLIATEAHGGRAILVGLSLGGYVAAAVAAGWPERVAGLAVSGITAEPVGVRSIFYRGLALALERLPKRTLLAANRRFFARRYPPRVADPILAGGFSFDGGAVALRSLVGERFQTRLEAYPGRILLINGQLDLFFRPRAGAFARAAAAERIVIRRATHLANLDQPELFTAAIRRFARSIVEATAG
jgi:pimeloyl-ACP methyl ester carboxylesterase